jgi:hypothetical protein
MRGKQSSYDLEYDPEIERTARALWKAVRLQRLSQFVQPSAREPILEPTPTESETSSSPKSIMGEPEPPRPTLGEFGLATHRGRLTHTFQPANPVAFDIKTSVQNGLKERQFDETDLMSTHEHLSHFAETCEFCVPPANVTESQKRLRLFPFTLTRRTKDWLLSLPT